MKRFLKAISLIHSEYVKGIVYAVLGKTRPEFFTAPSSSSGKYHPADEITEGGLVLHTLRVVAMADQLAGDPEYWESLKANNYLGYDILIASAILHDCCKSGKDTWGEHTVTEHPLLTGQLIFETCGVNRITKGIADTIAAHMGYANKDRSWESPILPRPTKPCQIILNRADYLASRANIRIDVSDLL